MNKKKGNLIFTSLRALVAVVLIFAVCTCAVACTGTVDSEGVAHLVLVNGDECKQFDVELSELEGASGAIALLDYLKSMEKIDYLAQEGAYGAYLGEVKTADGALVLKNDALAGKYISIYTSVAEDMDVSEYKSTVEYEGVTLTSSGVGISTMSVKDGSYIYITLISY